MDRNAIIGIILIVTIVFTFQMFTNEEKPAEPQKKEQAAKKAAETTTAAIPVAASAVIDSGAAFAKLGVMAPAAASSDSTVKVENSQMVVTFNARGGMPESVLLKNYKTYSGKPLELFTKGSQAQTYEVNLGGKAVKNTDLSFLISNATDSSVTLTAQGNDGAYIRHNFTLDPRGSMLNMSIETGKLGLEGKTAKMDWAYNALPQEKDLQDERYKTTIFYRKKTDERSDNINERKDDKEKLEDSVDMIAFKQKYFTTSLVVPGGVAAATIETATPKDDSSVVKHLSLSGNVAFDQSGKLNMSWYYGACKYYDLKEYGYGLQDQIYLGWTIFSLINKFFVLPIFTVLDKINLGYGIIILILSLIIKSVLFPLTYKSQLSTIKMRLLKPEVDALKAKYGDDNTTLQTETMKIYSKAGVNPLGGCLPLLLQMPLLFAMFNFFPAAFELRGQSFLWAEDLSTYDSLIHWGTSLPVLGNHLSLFTVLMTISTLIYTKINNDMTGATGQMKYIGYIMPLIFLGVLNSYASGLTYYYLLLNLITFAQQAIMRRTIDETKLHAQMQENKSRNTGKKSAFQMQMEKLQEAQKNQRKK